MSLAPKAFCSTEEVVGKWYLDNNLTADATIEGGVLSLRLLNTGASPRTISSLLMDERFLLSNVIRLRIHSDASPRKVIEVYNLYGDGLIGIDSSVFVVKTIEIKSGQVLEKKIELNKAIRELALSNEAIARWSQSGYRLASIVFSIDYRDIGVLSNAGIELKSPWIMLLEQSKDVMPRIPKN
jgi:hypothetical protein